MIQSDQKLTIVGKTNQTYIGVHHQTHVAPSNQHYVHTLTQNHSQPSHVHQPTTYQRHENNVLEYFNEHIEHAWYKAGIVALNIDVTGVLKFQWASLYAQYWIWRNKTGAIGELKITPLKNKISAFVGKIDWTQVAIAMAHANGVFIDVNAGLDLNETTPFS
jgi:hypothetical protein